MSVEFICCTGFIASSYEELISPFPAVQVLAGIVPRHFGRSEVFERLIALLRHQDKELGRTCTCSVHKEQICDRI